jgi:hypothetical protein
MITLNISLDTVRSQIFRWTPSSIKYFAGHRLAQNTLLDTVRHKIACIGILEVLVGFYPLPYGGLKSLVKWGRCGAHFTSDVGTGGDHITGVPISLQLFIIKHDRYIIAITHCCFCISLRSAMTWTMISHGDSTRCTQCWG